MSCTIMPQFCGQNRKGITGIGFNDLLMFSVGKKEGGRRGRSGEGENINRRHCHVVQCDVDMATCYFSSGNVSMKVRKKAHSDSIIRVVDFYCCCC